MNKKMNMNIYEQKSRFSNFRGITNYLSPEDFQSMPALAGGSLPVLGSGKIEQVLNSKSQMLKLCNPVFSPFIFDTYLSINID